MSRVYHLIEVPLVWDWKLRNYTNVKQALFENLEGNLLCLGSLACFHPSFVATRLYVCFGSECACHEYVWSLIMTFST